uniref:Putative secreted peptide n=1 Tax=Anopheles braziliensis TaxID=58242 RepID=A0A2M3ZSZ7_9DIPT
MLLGERIPHYLSYILLLPLLQLLQQLQSWLLHRTRTHAHKGTQLHTHTPTHDIQTRSCRVIAHTERETRDQPRGTPRRALVLYSVCFSPFTVFKNLTLTTANFTRNRFRFLSSPLAHRHSFPIPHTHARTRCSSV